MYIYIYYVIKNEVVQGNIYISGWNVRILIQRPVGIRRDEKTVSRYRSIPRDILSRFLNSRKYVSGPYSLVNSRRKYIFEGSGESLFSRVKV